MSVPAAASNVPMTAKRPTSHTLGPCPRTPATGAGFVPREPSRGICACGGLPPLGVARMRPVRALIAPSPCRRCRRNLCFDLPRHGPSRRASRSHGVRASLRSRSASRTPYSLGQRSFFPSFRGLAAFLSSHHVKLLSAQPSMRADMPQSLPRAKGRTGKFQECPPSSPARGVSARVSSNQTKASNCRDKEASA
jgi:hypothetical protein